MFQKPQKPLLSTFQLTRKFPENKIPINFYPNWSANSARPNFLMLPNKWAQKSILSLAYTHPIGKSPLPLGRTGTDDENYPRVGEAHQNTVYSNPPNMEELSLDDNSQQDLSVQSHC